MEYTTKVEILKGEIEIIKLIKTLIKQNEEILKALKERENE